MDKWELFDKRKKYYTKDGQELTYERLVSLYPAAVIEKMAVKTIGHMVTDIKTLLCLRAEYLIDESVSDKEAFEMIYEQDMMAKTESTPLERIAAALEFIAMSFIKEEKE